VCGSKKRKRKEERGHSFPIEPPLNEELPLRILPVKLENARLTISSPVMRMFMPDRILAGVLQPQVGAKHAVRDSLPNSAGEGRLGADPSPCRRQTSWRRIASRPERWPSLWGASITLALVATSPLAARADFRVCNKARALINLAVGANAEGDFSTEGWWAVTPGSCVTPIRGPLKGRYLYLYASDINGVDVLKGTVSMCIDRAKFKVIGIENCWRRGLQAVTFTEVDTLDSRDWTTFLTDVGN
jgi:uncharacterized membrane protein